MFAMNADSRLDALTKLVRMTTMPNEGFDRVTRLTAQLFGLPIAMILLTKPHHDWFRQHIGFEFGAICPDGSACADIAATQTPMVIADLQVDPDYRTSEFAQIGLRSYAGAPLVTRQGRGIGTLCVVGFEPRTATEDEVAALADFAKMVMAQVEMQVAFGRIDPISGMPNRNQFHDDLEDLAKDQPGNERLAVLVEIAGSDEMDQAALVMGSRYFDEIVNAAAEKIRSLIGEGRQLYHVAATQFAFLAESGAEEAEYKALLLSSAKFQNGTLSSIFLPSPRIGVAKFELGAMEPREILRRTHAAAQSARAAGETVRFYSSSDDEANARRFWILREVKKAISGGQLHLVYQPRVDLQSGNAVGVEALVRWSHPEDGVISPAEFVPIIEGTTHMRSLTDWVVDTALGQLAKWHADGLRISLSLNVAAIDLAHPDFVPMLEDAIGHHGIASTDVELELTEGVIMGETSNGLAKLACLSQMGFKLAIDDFGTGYSSLAYLQNLPADVVKIDRSFLAGVVTDAKARTLVLAMITLCKELGYRVVAEGIEDSLTRDLLAAAGCDEAQGYFYARPMLPDEFATWFTRPMPLVA